MPATKNTPSTHHPQRRNVTTVMVGLKERSHTQKSYPKVVNPRDIAGERNKKKNKQKKSEENDSVLFILCLQKQMLLTSAFSKQNLVISLQEWPLFTTATRKLKVKTKQSVLKIKDQSYQMRRHCVGNCAGFQQLLTVLK